MNKIVLVMIIMALAALGYAISSESRHTAGTADILRLMAEAKQALRDQARTQPHSLSLPVERLPWGVTPQVLVVPKGLAGPDRMIQLTLPATPAEFCADLLFELDRQRRSSMWHRLDVNGTPVPERPDLAARQRLCSHRPHVSVYFRF